MYQSIITSSSQALVHLAFHCCLKDGELQEAELQSITNSFVAAGLHSSLNLKDEMIQYNNYKPQVKNESDYLAFLVDIIRPTNKLALFSFCMELFLVDKAFTFSEEVMMNKLAIILGISKTENDTIQKLIEEMNLVQENNRF